jgi:hypothetical protein
MLLGWLNPQQLLCRKARRYLRQCKPTNHSLGEGHMYSGLAIRAISFRMS